MKHLIKIFSLSPIKKVFLWVTLVLLLSATRLAAEPPFKMPEQAELNRIRSAVIDTKYGKIVVQLFPEEAPWHVANFKYLADLNYYHDTSVSFHDARLAVQLGAAPKQKQALLNYRLAPEFNFHKHEPGTLSMARPLDDLDFSHERKSDAAQFNIMLNYAQHMDGNYTIFGKVVKGLRYAQLLSKGDKIKKITVYVKDKDLDR